MEKVDSKYGELICLDCERFHFYLPKRCNSSLAPDMLTAMNKASLYLQCNGTEHGEQFKKQNRFYAVGYSQDIFKPFESLKNKMNGCVGAFGMVLLIRVVLMAPLLYLLNFLNPSPLLSDCLQTYSGPNPNRS